MEKKFSGVAATAEVFFYSDDGKADMSVKSIKGAVSRDFETLNMVLISRS